MKITKRQTYMKAYNKAYKKEHAEDIRIQRKEYRKNNVKKIKAYRDAHTEEAKAYRRKHAKKIKAYHKAYARKHASDIRKYHKAYDEVYETAHAKERKAYRKVYYQEHAKEHNSVVRAYAKRHPERSRIKQHNRRARLYGNGGICTPEDEEKLLFKYHYRCPKCKQSPPKVKLTIDHAIPISCGGTSWPSNLQILCDGCNKTKGIEAWRIAPNGKITSLITEVNNV